VGSHWVVRVQESGALQEILRALTEERIVIRAVEPRRQSLEEYFVRALEAAGAGRPSGTESAGRR